MSLFVAGREQNHARRAQMCVQEWTVFKVSARMSGEGWACSGQVKALH
jgi:hypothetical protein